MSFQNISMPFPGFDGGDPIVTDQLNGVLRFTVDGQNYSYWIQDVAAFNTGTNSAWSPWFNSMGYCPQSSTMVVFDNIWNFTDLSKLPEGDGHGGDHENDSRLENLSSSTNTTGLPFYADVDNYTSGSCIDVSTASRGELQLEVQASLVQINGINGTTLGPSVLVPRVQFMFQDNATSGKFVTYDTFYFTTAINPSTQPYFYVNYSAIVPASSLLHYDAENVLGGDNQGFTTTAQNQTSVQMSLEYYNGVNFEAIPSAFTQGLDTAEKVSGVFDTASIYNPIPSAIVTTSSNSAGLTVYSSFGDSIYFPGILKVRPDNIAKKSIWLGSGTHPSDIAIDPRSGYLYISESSLNRVLVLDPATLKVIAYVSVGMNPLGIAFDNATNYVYVANNDSANVSVIDASTNKVIATVPVGVGPFGVSVDRGLGTAYYQAKVFVTNYGSDNVSIIYDQTNKVISSISVGKSPTAVISFAKYVGLLNTLTYVAYVSDFGSNMVSVVKYSTSASIAATIGVGVEPIGLCLNGTSIFVANFGSSNVSVIGDVGSLTFPWGEIVSSVWAGGNPYGISYNSLDKLVYVSLYGANAVRQRLSSGNYSPLNGYTSVGFSPEFITWDPNLGEFYLADFGGNSVDELSGYEDLFAGSMTLPSLASALIVDPNNGYVYVADSASDTVIVVDPLNRSIVTTVAVGTDPVAIALDTHYNIVYVANSGSNNLTLITASTNSIYQTLSGFNSPDGLVYDSFNWCVYVSNGGGNTVTELNKTTIVATLTVGTNPKGGAYIPESSTGGIIAIANYNSDNVSLIDANYGSVPNFIVCYTWIPTCGFPAGNEPEAITYDDNNNLIYVSNHLDFGEFATITIGQFGLAPFGAFVYVNSTILQSPTSSLQGIAVDLANNHVYVANQGNSSLDVISGQDNDELYQATSGVLDGIENVIYDNNIGDLLVLYFENGLGYFGLVSPSDPLFSGYVVNINNGSVANTSFVEDTPSIRLMSTNQISGTSYHSWINYTNRWTNDLGDCDIFGGSTLLVNGVPSGCGDPPGVPLMILPGWFWYPGISTTLLTNQSSPQGYHFTNTVWEEGDVSDWEWSWQEVHYFGPAVPAVKEDR